MDDLLNAWSMTSYSHSSITVDELTAAERDLHAVLEELTAPLNDAAARVIAAELKLQPAVADKAERWGHTKNFLG